MEIFEPVRVGAAPYGLYGAASPTLSSRLMHGLLLREVNCGPGFQWPLGCDPTPAPVPPAKDADAELPDDSEWAGIVVGSSLVCGLVSDEDTLGRAEHLLSLREETQVEAFLQTQLIAESVALPAVATLALAIGALEGALGVPNFLGVIHVPASMAARLAQAYLIYRDGETLKSPLGHTYAFGGGYSGTTMWATGPVHTFHGSVESRLAYNVHNNTKLAVAEREVLVAWECLAASVALTP